MSQNNVSVYRVAIFALTVILVMTLVQSPRTTQAASEAAPQAVGAQMLAVTVFDVNCTSLENVTTTYTKVTNLATFTVNSADSVMELTYNGRIYIDTFTESTQVAGAYFELRVDNDPSSVGRARGLLRWSNAGNTESGHTGLPVSITGIFTGLTAGYHTASMWVKTITETAPTAMVNPGCFESDVLIVKEHLPFGVVFLPTISK